MSSTTGGTIPQSGGYPGQAGFQTAGAGYGALDFAVRQIIAGKAFSGPVKVVAVHGGGVGVPPTVDVQPMVNQQDGLGNQVPHATVYGLGVFRLQGGNGACILDPAVGDIGDAIYADRDISGVKATQDVSPPGSFRQNSYADGIYYGGILNVAPTQYVQIFSGGIMIKAPNGLTIEGNIETTGTIKNNGVDIGSTHEHTLVTTGTDNSGPPLP